MAEKKTLKMYTTGAGAKQYGSKEDVRKHAKKAFIRFLANPSDETLTDLKRFDAAEYAVYAKQLREQFGDDAARLDDFFEKKAMTKAQQAKVRSLLKEK